MGDLEHSKLLVQIPSRLLGKWSDRIEVRMTENKGRGLYAKTKIKKGGLVSMEEPFVAVHDMEAMKTGTFCANCFKMVGKDSIHCNTCTSVFCSDKCKIKSKMDHEGNCSSLDSIVETLLWQGCDENNLSLQVLQAKIAARLMNESTPETDVEMLNFLQHQSGNASPQMMDVWKNLRKLNIKELDREWLRELSGLLTINALHSYLEGGSFVPKENASPTSRRLANISGLYFLSSIYNHSCDPNMNWDTTSGTSSITMTANRNIEKGDELTISYCPPPMLRKFLSCSGFVCRCIRCEERMRLGLPKLSIKPKCANCGKKGRGFQMCSKCKNVLYCGRDCQVKDWPQHKLKCSHLE